MPRTKKQSDTPKVAYSCRLAFDFCDVETPAPSWNNGSKYTQSEEHATIIERRLCEAPRVSTTAKQCRYSAHAHPAAGPDLNHKLQTFHSKTAYSLHFQHHV